MSDNPFEPPNPIVTKGVPLSGKNQPYFHDGTGRVFVRQIGVVAILMIVQSVLLAIFGLFCVGYAFFFWRVELFIPEQAQAEFNSQLPPGQRTMMVWLFGGLAVGALLLGLLFVVVGIFNFGLRGRTIGIATLLLGIGSAMTCYCGLTGIPLSIYGLIIYFNPAVGEAFRLRKTGLTKEQILATFVR